MWVVIKHLNICFYGEIRKKMILFGWKKHLELSYNWFQFTFFPQRNSCYGTYIHIYNEVHVFELCLKVHVYKNACIK